MHPIDLLSFSPISTASSVPFSFSPTSYATLSSFSTIPLSFPTISASVSTIMSCLFPVPSNF
ncbi:hypothetical protein P692DRAFT_20272662 [Suillus brevipes Sb2]|nr:hypothetical protein P692DRAFT_20272662 [Suillus brevipes Sb2]